MFGNVSVGRRLAAAFGAVCFIMLGIAGIGWWGIDRMSETAQHVAVAQGTLALSAARLRAGILTLRRYEKDTLLNVEDRARCDGYIQHWREAFVIVQSEWDLLRRLDDDAAEASELDSRHEQLVDYEHAYEDIVDQIHAGTITNPYQGNLAIDPHKESIRVLEVWVVGVADHHDQRMQTTLPIIIEDARVTTTLLSLFVLIGFGLSIAISYVTARSLTTPLVDLTDASKRLGAGNLAVEMSATQRSDELGTLTNTFRDMSVGMRKLVSAVTSGVVQLGSSVGEIATTSRQYSATATEQASAVAEINATISEIRQASQVAAASAKRVADSADDAARIGQLGRDKLAETNDTMRTINERVGGIASQILQLADRTAQIGAIVDAVNDLAEQSNLLAVNASIEAAKAGDQGRGFAVVATEVRSLAEQSKRATQQIRGILADVQRATQSTIMATEEGTKRSDDGRRSLDAARVVVENLASALQESSARAREIAAAVSQQAAGIAQMASALENVTQAGRDSTAGVKQLERAVQELSSLSETLQHSTARFQI
jgi:methyl-accepting chemotaxis protein